MRALRRFNGSAAAALASWLVAATLAGCGGGSDPRAVTTASSQDGAATAQSATTASAEAALHLFVPDITHGGLTTASTSALDANDAPPVATLKTAAAIGNNVQVDVARDELYTLVGNVVAVYAEASTLKANAVPARTFALPSTLTAPHTLFLDTARDELYVGGDTAHGSGEIVAYPYAHTIRGTPATPARALFIDHGVSFFTIDAVRQRLFVVNADAGVHVFADAGSVSGALVATTTIAVLGTGLAIDAARDRLYVADTFAGLILVDQASAAAPVITATVSIDDAQFVSIDAASDRAWVSAGGSLYLLEKASALTSARTLSAPATARLSGTVFGAASVR